MSQCFAEVVNIDGIEPHPNADRLEIAKIKGATVGAEDYGEIINDATPDTGEIPSLLPKAA